MPLTRGGLVFTGLSRPPLCSPLTAERTRPPGMKTSRARLVRIAEGQPGVSREQLRAPG